MDISVSARELFREFVGLAMRSCQQSEKECPRKGPGRKPVVPDWVIATPGSLTSAMQARAY
jgi:hypothetical protein